MLLIIDGISKSVLGACWVLPQANCHALCICQHSAPARSPPPRTLRIPASYQHVLCQPPLLFGQPAGNPEGKALLPEERVPAVPTPEGDDFSAVGQVGDERQLWVTGPVVNQRLCTKGHIPR